MKIFGNIRLNVRGFLLGLDFWRFGEKQVFVYKIVCLTRGALISLPFFRLIHAIQMVVFSFMVLCSELLDSSFSLKVSL